ncbi:Hsp20/alpha crystallin family protein [Massilia sp. W12]|uniref:Hsp20/alpha crystallin family protein n=1 Tax=Massilia sp. W12 TaxID=3126507 RepID=UPI0030CA9F00
MTVATRYDAVDLFDQVLNNMLRPRNYEANCKTRAAVEEVRLIRMDVAETDTEYLLWAELPGVKKEDIQIEIEGKQLVLTAHGAKQAAGQTAQENAQNAEAQAQQSAPALRPLLSERYSGKWTRRLQLPEEIDQEQAQAKYQDGVLELVLPKHKPKLARRLQVL